jgi:5-methylcytosine-specific restriction endonuclease McrA
MKCLSCNKETSNPKFCSKSCSTSYNNKFTKLKKKPACLHCGQPLTLTSRKYCSNTCQAEKTRQLIKEQIVNGDVVRHQQVRRYLIEEYGPSCMLCGWSTENVVTKKVPIELDHIDGDSSNNNLNNVRLLCPNCHSIQPTHKALNKGKGRHGRLQRYKEGKSY